MEVKYNTTRWPGHIKYNFLIHANGIYVTIVYNIRI